MMRSLELMVCAAFKEWKIKGLSSFRLFFESSAPVELKNKSEMKMARKDFVIPIIILLMQVIGNKKIDRKRREL